MSFLNIERGGGDHRRGPRAARRAPRGKGQNMAQSDPDDLNAQGIPEPDGHHDPIETDYDIGQDNIEGSVGSFGFDIHNPVFAISGLSVVAFVAYALLAPGQAAEFFGWLRPALTSSFDWFFMLSANVFVIFCLALIVLPVGKVRLGGAEATPDYSYSGWFAMLFAAGMGIGLMFFGVLEPAHYFGTPWGDAPLGAVRPFDETGALIAGNVEEARRMALAAASYHWALHPWAIYAVVALALVSVLRGLDGGVKVLSEINMVLAVMLLLFVLIAAGAATILTEFGRGLAAYAQEIVPLSNPYRREDDGYREGWTAFYWAWWISWSPFVGMFIARVSRGRTVREFLTCVVMIPSLVCVLWMSVFGGAAINGMVADPEGSAVMANVIESYSPELSLFAMLESLPLAAITSTLAIVLVIVFFVTSSDSGSLVIDTITAGGKIDAPVPQRVFWCTFEGLVAIALLIGGGLASLQAMVISTGLSFTLVLLALCLCIYPGLRSEHGVLKAAAPAE
jgi:choline-glycine betaine transporter